MKKIFLALIIFIFIIAISGIHGFVHASEGECHNECTKNECNDCPCVFHSNGIINISPFLDSNPCFQPVCEEKIEILFNQTVQNTEYQFFFFLRSPPA